MGLNNPDRQHRDFDEAGELLGLSPDRRHRDFDEAGELLGLKSPDRRHRDIGISAKQEV